MTSINDLNNDCMREILLNIEVYERLPLRKGDEFSYILYISYMKRLTEMRLFYSCHKGTSLIFIDMKNVADKTQNFANLMLSTLKNNSRHFKRCCHYGFVIRNVKN